MWVGSPEHRRKEISPQSILIERGDITQCDTLDMKYILLLALGVGFLGCSTTTPRFTKNDLSDYPSEVRIPPGTINTTRDTGNLPDVLNPNNLSNY